MACLALAFSFGVDVTFLAAMLTALPLVISRQWRFNGFHSGGD